MTTISPETTALTAVAPQVLLGNHLKTLKLPTFAREYEKVAMESAQDRADYPRYLLRLCELERIDRERRNIERRIRAARFPQTKSLDTFDFTAQPSLNKALVLELARCEWIEKRQNCCEFACNSDPLRADFASETDPSDCCVSILAYGPEWPGRILGDGIGGRDRRGTARVF